MWLLLAGNLLAALDINDAIVKIYAVQNRPDYLNPWNRKGPEQVTGSGCIIKGKKILTNAHVISDSTFIQVRRNGQSQRYTAHVESVSHAPDLAILTVADQDCFKGASCLELGELPDAQQEIMVYGFPVGGDTMCITKGVVSRVEHQVYVHSGLSLLAVQIDAAINPGNSGGPAIVNGRIAGVAMMGITGANNIGYIIPAPVIRHFMTDIADGRVDGFPFLGIINQNIENADLKRSVGLPVQQDGMLVVKVMRNASVRDLLQAGDVITGLDDQPVAGDGTVELRKGERTAFALMVQRHQVGEKLKVAYVRDGRGQSGLVTLTDRKSDSYLVPPIRYDVMPTYYIYGGLVFCPVSTDLLQSWGQNWANEAPKDLLALLYPNAKDDRIDEVVVLLRVLPSELNRGYHDRSCEVIKKVNGREIRSLRDLIAIAEEETTPFVTFENAIGQKVTLDRENVNKEQDTILKTYGITVDRSEDLKTVTPQAATAHHDR